MDKKIYSVYAPSHNLTFIIEESIGQVSGKMVLRVRGLYAGEPNDVDNELYYGDMALWIRGEK